MAPGTTGKGGERGSPAARFPLGCSLQSATQRHDDRTHLIDFDPTWRGRGGGGGNPSR